MQSGLRVIKTSLIDSAYPYLQETSMRVKTNQTALHILSIQRILLKRYFLVF
jgi:hypothetical protein